MFDNNGGFGIEPIDPDRIHDAAYLRERADEARAALSAINDEVARITMERVIEIYETLASEAQRRQTMR
jgi:hypothetical protein